MDYFNIGLRSYTIILFISKLSFIAGSNVNCNGKAFHCVNSTHFKICVDLGGGVSTTVDEFLIPCPQNTECKQYNLFECEFTTTLPPVTTQNEVTNEQFQTSDNSVWEQLEITTIFPMKQQQGMELSEKYFNKVNTTPANFTSNFLSDAVIDPVTLSNTKDLNTISNSDINKTLNMPRSVDKELSFSTTESGMDTAQTLRYNVNILETDIGVSSNYNTDISTAQDKITIDSVKSSKALNENSLDLNAMLTVTESTNQVSSVSELPYSATVKLLPGNFSKSSLQENIPQISNITQLIKSDNMNQESNPSIIYNTNQINKSDNNIRYRNTNNDKLNSTIRNDITDEKFINDVLNEINKSKVNSGITLELPTQYLAEATTNNYPIYLNTPDAIETFLNKGINITTNMEKLSVTDDIMISTSIISKTTDSKTNETSIQFTNSGLNYGVSNIAVTNPILEVKNATTTKKPQSLEKNNSNLTNDNETFNLTNELEHYWTKNLHIENNSQNLITTEPYFRDNNNTTTVEPSYNLTVELTEGVTSLNPISSFISFIDTRPSLETMGVVKDLNNNNIINTEPSINITAEISNGDTIFKPLPDLISKNETWPETVVATGVTDRGINNITTTSNIIISGIFNGVTNSNPSSLDLISKNETLPETAVVKGNIDQDSNNVTTTKPSNNSTAEISSEVTSLKSLSGLILKNETWSKPIMMKVPTDLKNNNTTTTEPSKNIAAEISNGVTILKPLSDLILKNETWSKPIMITVPTDLKNNNTTTTEPSKKIAAEISNGVTILTPLSDLILKNETWSKPITMAVPTDLKNNNTTTTEPSKNIAAEISNGVTILKPLSDLILKNETWSKPIMMTVPTDPKNNNTTTTETSKNFAVEISNGVTILKPLSDLILKNETWSKPIMMTVPTDLKNNNTTSTEPSKNIAAEISNGVTILKPLSDLILKNETWSKPIMMTVPTDLKNNNTTTTEPSKNIAAEISNGVTILKPLSDLILKNETWSKPIMMTVPTDLKNNNTTSTEPSKNIAAEISNGVTISKPLSDLILKNETWSKPIMMTVPTDLKNNNTTTTEPSKNIAAEISNGVTILKPLTDLILKNGTWSKPIMMTVPTDLKNNNTTTTEPSKNISAEISNGVTILKPLSDLILNNETWSKPIMMTVPTDLKNNNTTTTESSKNIAAEISNGVTILKPLSDLILKNETWSKPIMMTVPTDLKNNNTTTTEPSKNIAAEISNGVTIFKPLSDLILKNETWSKPIMMTVPTDLKNNNTTTTEPSKNISAEISNGVTILKPLSDLILNNETWSKPIMMTVPTDLKNNNTTTTESSRNIAAEISNGVTILKPLSDLILKNETWSKPIMMTVPTDLKNNNTTTTETSKNIAAEISNGVTILKPLSDLISKNETIAVKGNKDLYNNNTTITKPSNNITSEISSGVTILKPLSDLISKNETIAVKGNKDLYNNNTKITKPSNNITSEISSGVTILKPLSDLISKNETMAVKGNKDLYNSDTTTTETSYNITSKISNAGPTTLKIQPTDFKLLMVTDTLDSFFKDNNFVTTRAIFTDHQYFNEGTTRLSNFTKIPDYILMTTNFDTNSMGLKSSIDSVTSDLKQNTTSNTTSSPTTLDKPTTFLDRNSEVHDKNKTTYNRDITKPVHNSIYEINNSFSSNSTFINKISDVYETKTESDTVSITMKSLTGTAAFESANTMDVTKNTFAVIDELAHYRGVSDNLKSIDNTSKLESMLTAKPSTDFVSNTSSKQVNSSETKTVTKQSSLSNKKEINKTRVLGKNTTKNDEILDNNRVKNLNLTKLSTKHIIPKLVTSNNNSISLAVNITNLNNNITNIYNNITDNYYKNNLKDIEVKCNKSTNNLLEKTLIINITNTDFKYTYTNKASSVSSYSKSITNSVTKPFLTDIYKVNPRNLGENISLTHTFGKTTPSTKQNETEDKESSLITQHGNAPVYAIRNIEQEGNKTLHLLNPYNQVTTPAIEVNDTTHTLKEITYNFSVPSSTVTNNDNDFLMENITMTSANKNTTTKDFYDKEGIGFNKSNSTTKSLVNVNNYKNRSELADYFPLSEILNNQTSGYVINPLLLERKPLEKVNKSSLHKDNENLGLITEDRLQGHVFDRINKSKISEISNANRSEHIAPVKNITSSNWGVVNKMVVAKPTKTFIYDRNISEVKILSVLKIRDNYTHDLHATSESSLTTNNLLRNTSSQIYSNNKTHYVMSSNAAKFSRTLPDHEKSSQTTEPTNIIKIQTNPLVLKQVVSKQDKITVSNPQRYINTDRSNGIEEKQLRNGHSYLESTIIVNNVTKNIGNQAKHIFTTPINNVNNSVTKCGNISPKQEFTCTNRGKYSDTNNCNKFYVCIGRVTPVIGLCPSGTVFSEYLKQCTKHITHCIRNNQFKCTRAGRFINILSNNTYFICARNKSSFIRYRLQCQKGYYLDKYNIKCAPEIINISISNENNSKKTKELSFKKESLPISVKSKHVFECEKEGKFKDPQDCRRYYICKKARKSTFRLKIKHCDSDEVFHGKKNKCVDVESYECDN